MKKTLIPLIALSLVALVSCGGGTNNSSSSGNPANTSENPTTSETKSAESESKGEDAKSSDATVYSVSIKNKTALAAEWHLKDGTRALELELSPRVNLLDAFENGSLSVVSSNTSVVSTSNATLIAVAVGKATITVTYGNASDSVEVEILAAESAITKYGTVHAGTYEDPLDNADACKVGHYVKDNDMTSTTEELYIKGEVDTFYHPPGSRNDGACSWYLKKGDNETEAFEVYKCYKEDGSYLTDNDIWKGAVAMAHGKITFYGNQMETSAAVLDTVEGEKPAEPAEINATVAEAVTAGKALADGDSTWDYYVVTGYVVRKDGSNYWMSDTATVEDSVDSKDLLELYSIGETDAANLLKGAKVTVKMKLKNYHDQVENGNVPEITLVTAGEPWVINYIEKTVAEALTIAAALADRATSDEYYKIAGVILAVTTPYNAQYGNISFTIGDTADAAAGLTVFRLSIGADDASKYVPGASLTVGGKLQNYSGTYELVNPVVLVAPGEVPADEALDPIVGPGITVEEALEIISGFSVGEMSGEDYTVTGRVGEVTTPYSAQYGNISFTLVDDCDPAHSLTVFRLSCTAEQAEGIVKGAVVAVVGKLQKYNDTPEIAAGSTLYVYHGISVADALEIISEMNNGEVSAETYSITGRIEAITTPYNSQSGNITFTMADAKGDEDVLTVYRLSCTAEEAENILLVGAKITVTGNLQKYYNYSSQTVTPELAAGGKLWSEPVIEPYTCTINGQPVAITDVKGDDSNNNAEYELILDVDDVVAFQFDDVDLHFYHWDGDSATAIDEGETYTATAPGKHSFYINSDDEIYVVPPKSGEDGPIVDTLTAANFAASGGSYVNFTHTADSGIQFAGNSAKNGNGSIQLRSKNSNAGIIVTANSLDVHIAKIAINWDSSTSAERILDVYGKNTAYTGSDAAELYSGGTQGTKIGSIVYDNATDYVSELTFDDEYAFFGLRSQKDALYISSIVVTWVANSN